MLRRIDVAIDCADPDAQASFWADALGYRRHGSWEQYRSLVPPDDARGLPKLVLQQVPEAKAVKNRLHLDLVVDDVDAEVARLTALGATVVPGAGHDEPGLRWVLMLDPEGNELCVCSD